ncbi:MAG: class I SAM-dependent methyltransferase [Symploca sp. SIO2D2]|nr:class I SAM-dependent methyltransferase [Symploca sp. SIO2D2]
MSQTSIDIPADFADTFRSLLSLPQNEQPNAAAAFWANANVSMPEEEWNSCFAYNSLFEAWTCCSLMQSLYASNAAVLRSWLNQRPRWRVIEIGGGNGRFWSHLLKPEDEGELIVIDPVPEVHEQVSKQLPAGVRLISVQAPVETVPLCWEADAVLCSLTLHHVAGTDASERSQHGLTGIGKLEVLREIAQALKPRQGLGILNESDMYSDLGLPPDDPILIDHLLEAYVRRVGLSLLLDAEALVEDPKNLSPRWYAIIHRWCLGQLLKAHVPLAERDIYELNLPRWLELLKRAGLNVIEWKSSDNFGLFYRYLLKPA